VTNRYVVTGASGFLGASLARRLAADGAEVHALSRSAPPPDTGAHWHACDVADQSAVRVIFSKVRPQVVFHLAGLVTGSRDVSFVLPTMATNLVGTVHVLLAAAELGCQRVVCLGSLQEPDHEVLPVPNSPYAAAKFAASAYARMFAEVCSLPVSIGRPFMAYGPGQLDFTKVVPYVLSKLLRGESPEMSSGRQGFDWVFVTDVVEALLAIAASKDSVGKTVDIGTGVLTEVRDIALGLARRLGNPVPVKLQAIPDRRLEPTRCADIEATARVTGWRPRVALEEGLDRTVEWYRARLSQ
jgi:UDP-glucose 4-epimerase